MFLVNFKKYFEIYRLYQIMDDDPDGKIDPREFKKIIPCL